MKKIVSVFVTFFTLFLLVGAVYAAEPYKIGAVLSVTGRLSFLGTPMKKAMDLEVEQINKAGGINGHPLNFICYDTETSELKTVTFVKKLISQDKVSVILGPDNTGSTFATVDLVENAKVPMVSVAGSTDFLYPLEKRRYTFHASLPAEDQIEQIFLFLDIKSIHKIATLTVSNAFGEVGRKTVEKLAPIHGIKIVLQEKFRDDDKDITPQLVRIKASDAEGIILWCAGPTAIIATRNYYSLGIKIPLIGDLANATTFFMERVGHSFEGRRMIVTKASVASTLPDTDPIKQPALNFWRLYKDKYGEDPGTFALIGSAAMQIVIDALKRAGPDSDKLRDALEATDNLPTSLFIAAASPHNHIFGKGGMCIGTIKNGKWVYLPPAQW